jgi:hypothetical protein
LAETTAAPSTDAPASGKKSSLVKDWIVPIVVGLAVGAGLVALWQWKISPMLTSPAKTLVLQWDPYSEEDDHTGELEKKIRGLGPDAREDMLEAFRSIQVDLEHDSTSDEQKMWAGKLLTEEPFRDARSLVEIVRDPKQPMWDRRVAAAVLVDALGRNVDPLLVTDPLLEWLEDTTIVKHLIPARQLRTLRTLGIFPKDREKRYRDALVKLATGYDPGRPLSDGEKSLYGYDRHVIIGALQGFAKSDPEVRALLWKISLDEEDAVNPRAAAVRGLAEESLFDEIDKWKAAAVSKDDIVRQTVGENLGRLPPNADPVFDAIETALHADANSFARSGSVDAQIMRRKATMLPIAHELLEDSAEHVRQGAMLAIAALKDHVDGLPARQAHILEFLEKSPNAQDVAHAAMALRMMTGKSFGIAEDHIDLRLRSVDEGALDAFLADKQGRADAVAKWRAELGPHAVWTAADRRKALENLLTHKDPENVARAKAELAKLGQ